MRETPSVSARCCVVGHSRSVLFNEGLPLARAAEPTVLNATQGDGGVDIVTVEAESSADQGRRVDAQPSRVQTGHRQAARRPSSPASLETLLSEFFRGVGNSNGRSTDLPNSAWDDVLLSTSTTDPWQVGDGSHPIGPAVVETGR